MRSLRDDGWRLIREGKTTVHEVMQNTKDEEKSAFNAIDNATPAQVES
jgi:hypothetical protein